MCKAKNEKKFVMLYSSAIKEQLDSGKQLEDIEIDFHLSVLKQLHGKWLVEMFNFLPLPEARK